jgi:hypothetical protein
MIQRSTLHPTVSYSCLWSLEEKPHSWSSGQQQHLAQHEQVERPVAAWAPQHEGLQYSEDTPFYRAVSPMYEDTDDEDDENSVMDGMDYQEEAFANLIRTEEPLKGDEQQPDQTQARRIKFHSQVNVCLIPSHKDYSEAMKCRMWNSLEEIRVNAIRNQMQLYLDEEFEESAEADEDTPKFVPLSRMGMAQ